MMRQEQTDGWYDDLRTKVTALVIHIVVNDALLMKIKVNML